MLDGGLLCGQRVPPRESDCVGESLRCLYIQTNDAEVSMQVVVIQQERVPVDVEPQEPLPFGLFFVMWSGIGSLDSMAVTASARRRLIRRPAARAPLLRGACSAAW